MIRKLWEKRQEFLSGPAEEQMFFLTRHARWLTAGLLLCYLPILLISEWPGRDVAGRYAPMAEAFASGDFIYAFHPRCQIFHTSIAGIFVYITSCTGYMGCKLASFLFFTLSLFPFYLMMKRIFGLCIARGALLVFASCIQVVNLLAVTGERDSAKMFVQLLMAYALIEIFYSCKKIRNFLVLGIACGLAVCTRSDLAVIAGIFLLLCGIFECRENKLIWRTLTAALVAAAVSSLEVSANYHATGYVIPGSRFYYIIQDFFHTEPTWGIWFFWIVLPGVTVLILSCYAGYFLQKHPFGKKFLYGLLILGGTGLAAGAIYLAFKPASDTGSYLQSILEGISPVFFPLALAGIIFRKMTGKWTDAEKLLFVLFVIFDLCVLIQIAANDKRLFLSPRYIVPAIPLLAGWCWVSCYTAGKYLVNCYPVLSRKSFYLPVLVLALLFVVFLGYRREINLRTRKNDIKYLSAIKEISAMLKKEKMDPLEIKPNLFYYRSIKRPFVHFDCHNRLTSAAYLGGGSVSSYNTPVDILITSESKPEWMIRAQFSLWGKLEKCGGPLVFGKEKLQMWKCTVK